MTGISVNNGQQVLSLKKVTWTEFSCPSCCSSIRWPGRIGSAACGMRSVVAAVSTLSLNKITIKHRPIARHAAVNRDWPLHYFSHHLDAFINTNRRRPSTWHSQTYRPTLDSRWSSLQYVPAARLILIRLLRDLIIRPVTKRTVNNAI